MTVLSNIKPQTINRPRWLGGTRRPCVHLGFHIFKLKSFSLNCIVGSNPTLV